MLGADGKPLPPAIPPDTFWRVQEILKSKTEMHWRRNTTRTDRFLFRGFVRCATCGQPLMTISHRTKGVVRDYYVCRSSVVQRRLDKDGNYHKIEMPDCDAPRIRRETLDEMLDAVIAEKLCDPERLFKILKAHAKASLRDGRAANRTNKRDCRTGG